MPPTSDDPQAHRDAQASDPDYIVVQTMHDLERLSAAILSDRDRPIVALTPCAEGHEPVLDVRDVRALVGPGVRIYLIPDEELLQGFRETIGSRLRIERAAVRIWWPDASVDGDPAEHPLVVALEGERPQDTLEELAHRYYLSRPYVRKQMTLVEDVRAFLEDQLATVQQRNRELHQRLRDAQVECHLQRTRAEVAEARLAAAPREPDSS